jgi:hypothetical protein
MFAAPSFQRRKPYLQFIVANIPQGAKAQHSFGHLRHD